MIAFNVSQLLKEGVGASRQKELSGVLYDIDENNPGPIPLEGDVYFVVTPDGILATGEVTMTLTQVCRRCLELTERDMAIEIEEEFVPRIDVISGRALPATDEDEPELMIDEHHTLDLSEVLQQYAIAQILKPAYCRTECQGLCPMCGINRNIESCDCDTTQLDPRLAGLAQLLESSDSEE